MKRIDIEDIIYIFINGKFSIYTSPMSLSTIIANSSSKVEIQDYELYLDKYKYLVLYHIDREMVTGININYNKQDMRHYLFEQDFKWQPITSDMRGYFAEILMQ
jgi:hypothetical protein